MNARELFKEKTHIDADWFLLEILKVMGQYEDGDDFARTDSITMALDKNAKRIAVIRTSETRMGIERILDVPRRRKPKG